MLVQLEEEVILLVQVEVHQEAAIEVESRLGRILKLLLEGRSDGCSQRSSVK